MNTRSQWASSVNPSPTPTPFTAASKGFSKDWTASSRPRNPVAASGVASPVTSCAISFRSWPALKAEPVPVSTTTCTSLDTAASVMASVTAS